MGKVDDCAFCVLPGCPHSGHYLVKCSKQTMQNGTFRCSLNKSHNTTPRPSPFLAKGPFFKRPPFQFKTSDKGFVRQPRLLLINVDYVGVAASQVAELFINNIWVCLKGMPTTIWIAFGYFSTNEKRFPTKLDKPHAVFNCKGMLQPPKSPAPSLGSEYLAASVWFDIGLGSHPHLQATNPGL